MWPFLLEPCRENKEWREKIFWKPMLRSLLHRERLWMITPRNLSRYYAGESNHSIVVVHHFTTIHGYKPPTQILHYLVFPFTSKIFFFVFIAWYWIDIVRRRSVLVTHGRWSVNWDQSLLLILGLLKPNWLYLSPQILIVMVLSIHINKKFYWDHAFYRTVSSRNKLNEALWEHLWMI